MNTKNKQPKYKSCIKAVAELDEKGVVKFYASVFGNIDRVGDIVTKGAYKKTIRENYSEIQHYKNHDSAIVPGVITEMYEDEKGLVTISKLMLKTNAGSETYEYYKAMSEAGKKAVHSIGYVPVKEEQKDNINYVSEIYLQEVSTLTKLAANPEALTIGIKELENYSFEDLYQEKKFFDCLINGKFEDVELEKIQKTIYNLQNIIESRKALLINPEPSTDTQKRNVYLQLLNL